MEHDGVEKVGLKGLRCIQHVSLKMIQKLEASFVYLSAKCFFPHLKVIRLLDTTLPELRNTLWDDQVAPIWVRWLPIFEEKELIVEDGEGEAIDHDSFFD